MKPCVVAAWRATSFASRSPLVARPPLPDAAAPPPLMPPALAPPAGAAGGGGGGRPGPAPEGAGAAGVGEHPARAGEHPEALLLDRGGLRGARAAHGDRLSRAAGGGDERRPTTAPGHASEDGDGATSLGRATRESEERRHPDGAAEAPAELTEDRRDGELGQLVDDRPHHRLAELPADLGQFLEIAGDDREKAVREGAVHVCRGAARGVLHAEADRAELILDVLEPLREPGGGLGGLGADARKIRQAHVGLKRHQAAAPGGEVGLAEPPGALRLDALERQRVPLIAAKALLAFKEAGAGKADLERLTAPPLGVFPKPSRVLGRERPAGANRLCEGCLFSGLRAMPEHKIQLELAALERANAFHVIRRQRPAGAHVGREGGLPRRLRAEPSTVQDVSIHQPPKAARNGFEPSCFALKAALAEQLDLGLKFQPALLHGALDGIVDEGDLEGPRANLSDEIGRLATPLLIQRASGFKCRSEGRAFLGGLARPAGPAEIGEGLVGGLTGWAETFARQPQSRLAPRTDCRAASERLPVRIPRLFAPAQIPGGPLELVIEPADLALDLPDIH